MDRIRRPRGCSRALHRHGFYTRYCRPAGVEKFPVRRFLCPECGHTVSVLPPGRLTYRPLEVPRLESAFDVQAGIRSGLDPPPGLIEASCLERAWSRFLTRVNRLREAFGQILPARIDTAEQLWKPLRQRVGSAEQMLRFLAQSCKCSLLGDYACLRPAP